jgi:tetratricopeptide (TPR) repeat protein
LNGTNVSIDQFPARAIALYQKANLSAPNRAINTLGIARTYLQMGNTNQAVQLYQALLTQMTLSNNADPIFSEEALTTIAKYNGAASINNNSFLLSIFILCIFSGF